jgi:hypothetical protein
LLRELETTRSALYILLLKTGTYAIIIFVDKKRSSQANGSRITMIQKFIGNFLSGSQFGVSSIHSLGAYSDGDGTRPKPANAGMG